VKNLKLIFLPFLQFIILALFVAAANAGAIWPYSAWPAAHVSGPIAQIASSHAHYIAAPAHVIDASPLAYSHIHAAPLAYSHAHIAHAPVVVAPAHLPAHAATYKAQTLGATHIAPLPGHTIDRANLNLAAPPTH
jgi:hypothetical protein